MSDWIVLDAEDLWNHAVGLYRGAGVEAACLELQNRAGAEVAVLLYACWRWRLGRPAHADELYQAHRDLDGLRERVLRPLRALRADWKQIPEAVPDASLRDLRASLLEVELQAERIAMGILAGRTPSGAAASLREALGGYLGRLAVLDEAGEAAVAVLVSAASR